MNWKDLQHRLEYAAVRLASCGMAMLSLRQTIWCAQVFAWCMMRVLPRKLTRTQVAYDNLQAAFPGVYSQAEAEEIIRKMWVHLFRVVLGLPRLCRRFRIREQRLDLRIIGGCAEDGGIQLTQGCDLSRSPAAPRRAPRRR